MNILDKLRDEKSEAVFTCDYCGAEIFEGDECCVVSGGGVYCANCFSAGPVEREREENDLL